MSDSTLLHLRKSVHLPALLAMLLLVICGVPTSAQQPPMAQSPTEVLPIPMAGGPQDGSAVEGNRAFPKFPGDFMYLMGPDGKLVPVPFTKWTDIEAWMRQQTEAPKPPAYAFSAVNLEGSTTEDKASFSVKVSIQISEENADFVKVPLGFHEGILKKFQHAFEAPAGQTANEKTTGRAIYGGFDRGAGYQWWLRGRGLHVLTLDFSVPVKKTAGVRRIQLAVPSAAISYLRLSIPVAKERFALDSIVGGAHQTKALSKNETELEVFRLGNKLDVGWRALPDSRQVQTVLQAETELRVEPTEESILLKARQLVEPLQGSMQEISVTLPEGFSVVELKVDGERFRPMDDYPKSPKPLTIPLAAATTNRVRLEWILQAPWPESDTLTLEGFNVAGTLRQEGEIAIVAFDGYRIVKGNANDVYRINVRELLGPGPIASAYKFLQQPFRLDLNFEKIEPSYSVRPHLFLKFGPRKVEMAADLELDVYRGILDTLEFDWKDFAEQGWTIDRAELPGLVEMVETDPETGRLTFYLAKRFGQGTKIPLLLRANRSLDNLPAKKFALSLPRVLAPTPVRTVVVATHYANMESTIQAIEGTTVQPLSALYAEEVETLLETPRLRDIRGERQNGFLVRSDQHDFQVDLVTHPQQIDCETQVRVELADDQISIEQILAYDIDYQPASQLRIMVPRSFPENVQFSLGSIPLMFEWTGLEVAESRQARLTLPEAKFHQFEITARYQIPQSSARDNHLRIPLAWSSDARQVAGRLEFVADYPCEVILEEADWLRVPDENSQEVWRTTNLKEMLNLSWSSRTETDIQRLRIPKALFQSAVLPDGQITTQAFYRLPRNLEQLLIHLPPDLLMADAFHWNGQALTDQQVSEVQAGSGRLRLQLPAVTEPDPQTATESVLAVTYHLLEPATFQWSQHMELPAPAFPGDVWIEDAFWDVTLPVDQHLFTLPEGYLPEFSWKRQGVFWNRAPRLSNAELADWFGISLGQEGSAIAADGNTYRFRYFGPPPALRFSSINRSIAVFFGAGLALFSGFVLLKIPSTRNVLTVLVMVFAFAVCGIWFSAPMELLLQPALLGLLLAMAAVLIDSRFKKNQSASVVAIPGSGEYGGSSFAMPGRSYPDPIGSEDPTAVRPAPSKSSMSALADDHHNGQGSSNSAASELIGSSLTEKPE